MSIADAVFIVLPQIALKVAKGQGTPVTGDNKAKVAKRLYELSQATREDGPDGTIFIGPGKLQLTPC